ncbi:hypothetical protein RRG08_032380 [Elysia crispata]|uniref:Uncharacterized protein n=1 Tax=Elysia crispata TaxID=231223 RepID=A0AAE1DY88_9GAST|nr:hypothetical protein RRG08_032380 [Elysia crispata]
MAQASDGSHLWGEILNRKSYTDIRFLPEVELANRKAGRAVTRPEPHDMSFFPSWTEAEGNLKALVFLEERGCNYHRLCRTRLSLSVKYAILADWWTGQTAS